MAKPLAQHTPMSPLSRLLDPGAAVRAVVESAGVSNVMTKSLGTANPHNVVRAAFTALQQLKDPVMVARLRGKDLEEMLGAASA